MFHCLKTFCSLAVFLCLSFSGAEAAAWDSYRLAGFRAYGDGDYARSVEQFEAALVVAYEEQAPPDHLGAILENLATSFLAAGQPQRAWEAIERWDKILAASADKPWVPQHKKVRNDLAPLILEALAQRDSPPSTEPSVEAAGGQPTSGDYAIHLESLKVKDNAEPSWAELKANYPAQLSDKSLVVRPIDLGEQGTFFRILAAPFASSEEAQKACRQLRGLGQYCAVVVLN